MVKTSIKILAIIAVGLLAGILPKESFSAEKIKVRHLISVYSDEQGIGLKQPEGLACNDKSLLIVADSGNGRLLRYNFENRTLASKTSEIKIPQLLYPIRAQLNSRDEIYVLDRKLRRIARLSAQGDFKNYLDPTGATSPEPFVPRSFHIDRQDKIYVLDIFSERVVVLDPEGQYLREIKFPKNKGFFSDLTVDVKGDVFLIDSVNAVLFANVKDSANFSPLTKSLKEYMRFPTNLAMDNRGRLYLLDRNGSGVIILGQDGAYLGRLSGLGWREGLLNYPSQLCINEKGEIFIADTNNSRVQIFSIVE